MRKIQRERENRRAAQLSDRHVLLCGFSQYLTEDGEMCIRYERAALQRERAVQEPKRRTYLPVGSVGDGRGLVVSVSNQQSRGVT